MEELDSFSVLSLQASHIKEELDEMLKDNQITEDEYNKSLTELAYSFIIDGYPGDGLQILLTVKGDYFKKAAIKQFEEDAEFFAKCSLIFEVFSYMGYIDYDIMSTQSPGDA